jgi:CubicO group peptidase (beta-lactamase class C family)
MLLLSAMALPTPSLAQSSPPPTTSTPAATNTPGTTAAGVSYTLPAAWTGTVKGGATVLAAPEGDTNVAIVDVGPAADARAAASAAWRAYTGEPERKVRLVTPVAPGDGWEERSGVSYETSPNEKKQVSALALRKGSAWTVMIFDGGDATLNKRSAAAGVIQQSLRPAGYMRESFAGKTAHPLTPERVQTLRNFLSESMRTLKVPGVGLALIDGGKVVYQGGIGVRELGGTEPVDADTKFMIASNTKGLSSLLLSVLADDGKLKWDQNVTALYPEFRLGNGETTRQVLVRHLLCACTGLPRNDYGFILADAGAPAASTFTELASSQPTSGFGELFQYSNFMAAAAGYIGGHLAYPKMELGAAYDRAMQDRIFGPLGMRNTGFDMAAGESGNWARPNGVDVDGKTVELSNAFNHVVMPYRPTGGAWSTAADMARFVQLELSKGLTPEGKRLVSEANLLERRKRGVSIGEDGWYGMGLMERIESGVPVVFHGGTLQGYHSNWWALPEAGIGAVLLTNADAGASLLAPFLRRLLEVVYEGQPEAAAQVTAAAARIEAGAKARREKLTLPGDPAVLSGLATRYRSSEGSTISFSQRDGALWMKAGFVEGPVATRANADGSVSIVSAGPGLISVEALVGGTPGARTLTVRDSQHVYAYTEAP